MYVHIMFNLQKYQPTHEQVLENGCTCGIHLWVVGHSHGPQLLLWVIDDHGVFLSLEHDIACLVIHNLTNQKLTTLYI